MVNNLNLLLKRWQKELTGEGKLLLDGRVFAVKWNQTRKGTVIDKPYRQIHAKRIVYDCTLPSLVSLYFWPCTGSIPSTKEGIGWPAESSRNTISLIIYNSSSESMCKHSTTLGRRMLVDIKKRQCDFKLAVENVYNLDFPRYG